MEISPTNTQAEPKPDRSAVVDSLLNGVRGNFKQSAGIREELHASFKATEYVKIHNFTDKLWVWAYTDPSEEVVEMPDKVSQHVYYGEAKARTLEPGETVIIPGWEAYIGLDRVFKIIAQDRANNGDDGQTYGIISQSSEEINDFLSKAFLGVFNPNDVIDQLNAPKDVAEVPKAEATEDLGFASPEDKKQSTTAKASK